MKGLCQYKKKTKMTWRFTDLQKWHTMGCTGDDCTGRNPSTYVKFVEIHESNLKTLTETFFLNLFYLETISISATDIETIPEKIFDGLQNLKVCFLSFNQIKTISENTFLQTPKVNIIDMSDNMFVSLPKKLFYNLRYLSEIDISNNKLLTIPEKIFECLPSLTELNMSYNQLTTLPEKLFENLKELREIDLSNNNLQRLFENTFTGLSNLGVLYIEQNKLTQLPEKIFDSLVNLYCLDISSNKLVTLSDNIFYNLVKLGNFDIHNNELTTFPSSFMNLVNLEYFYFYDNFFDYIPPNIERMLRRLAEKNVQGVYKDSQSVHNSEIQHSLKNSIIRLINISPVYKFTEITYMILNDIILTEETKRYILDYCKDDSVHLLLNLTFREILEAVWNRILSFEISISNEIKKTLNIEMKDAQTKCFTGRISRLVNCLSGFDELVVINISDSEQIGLIIALTKNRLPIYTIDDHKKLVTLELQERGYSQNIIDLWTGYIE